MCDKYTVDTCDSTREYTPFNKRKHCVNNGYCHTTTPSHIPAIEHRDCAKNNFVNCEIIFTTNPQRFVRTV